MNSKIHIIKKEFQINDCIKIIRNDCKELEGVITEFGNLYLKLKTSVGIVTIFDNLIGGWESVHTLKTTSPVKDNFDNYSTLPVSNICTKNIEVAQNNKEGFDNNYLKDLSSFCEIVEKSELNFNKFKFDFKLKDLEKISVSEDLKQVQKQLVDLKNKYDYAIKVKENIRLKDILISLQILQQNNYFDNDIRYNIAFIYYKIGEKNKAEDVLKEAINIDRKPSVLHFLCTLCYDQNNLLETSFYLNEILKEASFDRNNNDFAFFVKLIQENQCYELLDSLFQCKLEKNFEYEIEAIIYAVAYLLKSNNFEKEAFTTLTKFLSNKTDYSYIKNAFNDVISLLTAKPRNQIIKFLSEKSDIKKLRLVPANAEVYDYNIQQQYGNLRFSIKSKGYSAMAGFYLKDVLDEDLKIRLSNFKHGNTLQVVCNIKPINKFQESAYNIQIPKDAKVILDLANNFIAQKRYEMAEGLATQVLQTYPDDQTATELKLRVSELLVVEGKQYDSKKAVGKKYLGSNYSRADQARKDKDWDAAIVYFKKAIENNENTESAIKDIASIYQQRGNISEAIKLVEDNFKRFTNKEAAYNFISNLYIAAKDYKNAIKSLSNLSDLSFSQKKDTKKSIDIKKRLAYCYLKDGVYESAKRLLNEILKKSPDDASAKNWLDALIDAEKLGTYEKVDTLFKESDFLILSGGLSPIIEYALQKCDFAGIPATVIAKGDFFNQKTLNSLRDQIHRAGKTRHQDKARYLLTEAKLMQGIDIGDERQIKTVLARYCTAMALSCAASNYPSDIVRSYYLECFSFENNWFYLEMQVSNYLQSFYLIGDKLILSYDTKPSIEKTIKEVFESDNEIRFLWNGILEMFITNTAITAQVLGRIYKNEKAKKSALDFLSKYQITVIDNITEEHFRDKWNEAREKRKREFEYWFNTIRALTNTTILEGLLMKIDNSLQESRMNWLQQTDTHRLDKVSDIVSTIKQYQVQTAFDEKERLFGIAIEQIEKLLQEIEERPTRFSFEGFRPLLQSIKDLLNQSFENVLKASTPKISIALLGEFVCDYNNQIDIQVAVRNDKQCSPINDIKIGIVNNENCQLVGEPAFNPETLKGGNETILKLTIKVSKSVVDEKVTDLELICSYKSRNADDETTIQSLQTLNLYPESEFESIDNVFSRVADSGPVEDKSMFKGRDEFINNIADTLINSKSKCVVIYGQKRSGKSSVLHHLKEKLKQTNRVLCINFSLGDIISNLDDLNTMLFYYKILAGLEDEVDNLKANNVELPAFTCPSYQELNQSASIIFDEKLKMFKKECQKLSRGQERNIILMIDEFTYLYSAIMRGKISEYFMKTWKALIEKGIFTAVLVGQDVMPKFKAKFPNEFGVTEDKRLTYLKTEDARELIEKPIWDMKRNKTRFIGKAIDRIIDYTAANPYYVQIFCARLVEYMNTKKAICATEVHVKEVAESLTRGSQALTEDKFDNLLTAGDADSESVPVKDTLDILRQIANASQNLGYCSRDSISLKGRKQDDIILEDLLKRDVLSVKDGYYRIQVQLFQDWLLNH